MNDTPRCEVSAIRSFFMEASYVSRIYADSLRDSFAGFVPTDPVKFARLRDEFDGEAAKPRPHFATLLGIEAGLVEVLPDRLIASRLWAVEDRFNRVVPACARARYEASVKPRGDEVWTQPDFLRHQTRALLEAIHNNYLTNIAREKSVSRLKAILAIASVVAVVAASALASHSADAQPYVLLALAGIFGAVLSIANRLQTAVARDATTEDGLAEVYGLRTGWAGVLVSMFLGGGFALVLYGVVMAGLPGFAAPTAGTMDASARPAEVGGTAAGPPPALRTGAGPGLVPLVFVTGTNDVPRTAGETVQAAGRGCSAADGPPCATTRRLAASLGLRSDADLFKMLILAFLAGFAERLAPDILGRLSKGANRP